VNTKLFGITEFYMIKSIFLLIYCNIWYHCYAMIMRRNMHCLVTASKHVTNNQAIARQLLITAVEGLLEAVLSVRSALRPYSEDLRPAECSSVE
jgi:hypothetical protein